MGGVKMKQISTILTVVIARVLGYMTQLGTFCTLVMRHNVVL